ncbi:MAG: ABC transporter ATP-binding protein [Brevinematales bacterium]|nr:ABC transporter ATP-binding protein [Brevinematales bacterium]
MIEIQSYKVKFSHNSLIIPKLIFENKGLYLIVGENGCGKTTFVRSILNIFTGYEGKILIDGVENYRLSRKEIASKISYLPQEENTTFPIRVKDFIETGLYSQKENIFDIVVDFLGLKSYLELDYNFLSGGERQLVRIARSIVGKVKYSILDEPDTFLSKKNHEKIVALFSYLSSERGIILVSHSQNNFRDFELIDFEKFSEEE